MNKSSITKEQFNQYMDDNWNQHFFKALVEAIKDELFPGTDKELLKDWREEIKYMIINGIASGMKEFFSDYEKEFIENCSEKFIDLLDKKKIYIGLYNENN